MIKRFINWLFGGKEILIFTLGNDNFPASHKDIDRLKTLLIEKGLKDEEFIAYSHTLKVERVEI